MGKTTRVDAPLITQGKAKYTSDIVRPGMLYGQILGSPHARARVRSIDLSAAKSLPGVKATIILKDPSKPVAATISYQGEEVAAVAATTEQIAAAAARLIKIDYEVLEPLATVEQSMSGNAPAVFPGGNVSERRVTEEGDVEAALKTAAHVIEGMYSTQVQTHASLETHGGIAEWDGDKLLLHVSTQSINASRDGIADALRMARPNVRVLTEYMGGGFGSKLGADVQVVIAARLAKEASAPVKVMLDRKHEHLVTGNRPSAYAKVRAGVDADGKFAAWDADTWGTGGAVAGAAFSIPYAVYDWPARRQRHRDVFINAGPQRPFRAPGHPQACFITEVVIDELADRLGIDPLELRLRNLKAQAPDARWRQYFTIGAAKIGWSARHATGDEGAGPIKRGLGCAAHMWPGGGKQGTSAVCEIHPDGSVVTRFGTQDIGTGTRTLIAMVTANTLGLPIDAVTVAIGDTDYPFAPGSGGSVTAASLAPAVRNAAEKAVKALYERIQASPADGLTWKDACKRLGTTAIQATGEWTAGQSGVGTSGVQFADVSVDVETGVTRVNRIVAVQDCGLIVNRLTAESQVYGGIVMGLGFALFENRIIDRNTAQMVNPDMEWYLLPGTSDVPLIDVTLVDQPERGVIGLGEPPVISTAAAIANAVANAIGARIRSLPITPATVLAALQQRSEEDTR